MTKSHLKLVAPSTENRTVATPRRRANAELRTREYLTDAEVARLQEAAKANRWGHRDSTMILIAYRHGFRSLPSSLIYAGTRSTSITRPWPFAGSRRVLRARIRSAVMSSEHCAGWHANKIPSRPSCSRQSAARRSRPPALLAWWSALARLLNLVLRPTRTCCGTPAASPWPTRATIPGPCRLYLGHKNIQHTVRYTELAPDRFKDFWR